MARVCLSLGSNVAPRGHLRAAVAALRTAFDDVVVSPVYRFPAVGYDGPDFLNAAALITTSLSPAALNDWLHALEDAQGRDRSGPRYSDRTLDIDIVLYDALVTAADVQSGSAPALVLQIPRDELQHAFVLKPLAEIAPDWCHPVTGVALAALWATHAEHDVPFARVALDD